MKNFFFLFAVCFLPLAAHAQNEWVLQPYIEVTGSHALQYLGRNVSGFMGSFPNNPHNVAVSEEGRTGLYSIHSPNDTSSKKIYFGENVVHGDFNGDHYTDFAIWKNLNFSPIDTVVIYWGTATGMDTLNPTKILSEAEYTNFGKSKCAGDINGDGVDDLVVTASLWGLGRGKVYIYIGGTDFSQTPSYEIIGSNRAQLGTRCSAGDLNRDGFDDLVLLGSDSSSPNSPFGYINIYWGGAQFDTTKDLVSLTSADAAFAGMSVLDANGDSQLDLLWTRYDTVSRDNKIYVHFGGIDFSERFARSPDFIIPNPDSQHVAVGGFGEDIANAGDMNGDGNADIVVGTRSTRAGNSFIFVFSAGKALDGAFDAAKGQSLASEFGWSVAGLGDVNGDGLSDVIVGAPHWKFGTREGYWGIFLGDRQIPTSVQVKSSPPTAFTLHQNYPNPFNASTRIEFSLPEAGRVQMQVFNINGALVRNLLDAYHTAGTYAITWDGNDEQRRPCASGIYFLKLSLTSRKGGEVQTTVQKMLLTR
jgi:hypothetical protein